MYILLFGTSEYVIVCIFHSKLLSEGIFPVLHVGEYFAARVV